MWEKWRRPKKKKKTTSNVCVGPSAGWHHLTCLNGANKPDKKPSGVVQRQVEVDDVISRDPVWWQNSQNGEQAVLVDDGRLGEACDERSHRQHKAGSPQSCGTHLWFQRCKCKRRGFSAWRVIWGTEAEDRLGLLALYQTGFPSQECHSAWRAGARWCLAPPGRATQPPLLPSALKWGTQSQYDGMVATQVLIFINDISKGEKK